METRSKDLICTIGSIKLFNRESMNLSVLQQLPTYRYLYERYFTMQKEGPRGNSSKGKSQNIISELSMEFTYIWTHFNIPFKSRRGIEQAFAKLINKIEILKRYSVKKRGSTFVAQVEVISKDLDIGVDIFSEDRIKILNTDLGIEYEEEEKCLYKDNCKRNEEGVCPRLRWCGGEDTKWINKAIERKKRLERKEYLKTAEIERYRKAMEIPEQQNPDCTAEPLDDILDIDCDDKKDEEFIPGKTAYRKSSVVSNTVKPTVTTRSFDEEVKNIRPIVIFPDILVRTGYKTFNMDIIEGLIVAEAVYKVEARKARQLLAYFANKIFKQNWTVAPEKKIVEDEAEDEAEDEEETVPKKKRRSSLTNLDYQLPHRETVENYISDFSLLSFKDMAESIVNAKAENKSVTYGVDDTVKAAGHKRHDVKTTHITIRDEEKNRETFTSGFYPNASHSGEAAAETVKHDIAKMAVLTNSTYKEILSLLDFFMTDRAGDADAMLDKLDIDAKKRLKCNAHVLLAVDVALDKVFRDVETRVGVANLIGKGASHVFSSPKNSIWYLGLIAVAKLLSPSHSVESISLYNDYTKFLSGLNDKSA